MDISQWISLFGICLLGAMSPGPSLAVVLNSTLRDSPRAGYTSAISHGLAVGLYGLLTVAGLAVLITRSPGVFTAMQGLGGLYLIYLGIKSLRSRGSANLSAYEATNGAGSRGAGAPDSHAAGDPASGSPAAGVPAAGVPAAVYHDAAMNGFLVAFLNPKLAIFMLALFSLFLEPGAGTLHKGIMIATVGITDATWYCLVVALLSRTAMLDKLRRSSRMIDIVFGVILIGLALSVLLSLI